MKDYSITLSLSYLYNTIRKVTIDNVLDYYIRDDTFKAAYGLVQELDFENLILDENMDFNETLACLFASENAQKNLEKHALSLVRIKKILIDHLKYDLVNKNDDKISSKFKELNDRINNENLKEQKISEIASGIKSLQSELKKLNNSVLKQSKNMGNENTQSKEGIHTSRNEARTEILTNQVWPKSRMLFAIVSKMSKENILNNNQRGRLKDLILDYDSNVLGSLHEYELTGDRKKLYSKFLELSMN